MPKFSIPPNKDFTYELKITPILGGIYTGCITFYEINNKQKYVWYTICVNTERPKTQKTIELQTYVRKTIAFEIVIENPHDETLSFDVSIEGESLMGIFLLILEP